MCIAVLEVTLGTESESCVGAGHLALPLSAPSAQARGPKGMSGPEVVWGRPINARGRAASGRRLCGSEGCVSIKRGRRRTAKGGGRAQTGGDCRLKGKSSEPWHFDNVKHFSGSYGPPPPCAFRVCDAACPHCVAEDDLESAVGCGVCQSKV